MSSFASDLIIGVVSSPEHPGLKYIPESLAAVSSKKINVKFQHLIKSPSDLVDALLYLPPAPGEPNHIDAVYPKLKRPIPWMHCFFAGTDSLTPFLNKNSLIDNDGFMLTNGRSAFSDALAEWVLTSVLFFNKQIFRLLENQKTMNWERFFMDTVNKKAIAFIGFGHIAQETAKLLHRTFGSEKVRFLVLKRTKNLAKLDPELEHIKGSMEVYGYTDCEKSEYEKIYSEADYIVSTLPGTSETQNFFGAQQFDKMKPGSVFISIGRGTVVDEDALVRALENGPLKGAALDVFKKEPLPKESKLWKCSNLLLSPHIADYTDDYFQLGWEVYCKNLEAFIENKPFFTPVNKSLGY